jgi:acyl-CoA synthetase (AMP-forming)/AMP-acid ligase II
MIFKSPFPDITIPEISLAALILESTERLGDKPAFIDGLSGRTITYKQMGIAIERMAAALNDKGFRKGDVFAIYSPNVPEYAIAFNATALAGGAVTTVNPLASAEDLAQQLNATKAKFLITISPFLEKAKAATKNSSVREIFLFDKAEGFTSIQTLIESTKELCR